MALLVSYMVNRSPEERLEDFLSHRVFDGVTGSTIQPDPAAVEGFDRYARQYKALLEVERCAVEILN